MTETKIDDEMTVLTPTKVTTLFVMGVANGRRVSQTAIAPRYVVVWPGMDRWIAVTADSDNRAKQQADRMAALRHGGRVIKVVE